MSSPDDKPAGKKNWKDIAEVRMLMYIIPVAAVLAIIAILLGNK